MNKRQGECTIKAEIIAIGTELLLGQIINSNAQYISQQLAQIGIDVYFQTVVGDNKDRLQQALQIASERADLVICTGGLGPTEDDITKQILAQHIHKSVVVYEPALYKIEQFFRQRGTVMTDNNARQAWLIEDSDPLDNEIGMAVGLAVHEEGTNYILLPGPPREMKTMFEKYAKPWLVSKAGHVIPLHSAIIKFAGIGESALEDTLIDLIHDQDDPTIAPYATEGEVSLRLSTKADDAAHANEKLYTTKQIIYERLAEHIYAEEEVSLEQVVVDLLQQRHETMAAAESCTGGLLAHMITNIPGSSTIFKGSIVCYSNEMKSRQLQVPLSMLEGSDAPGAVSAETAQKLAEGVIHSTQTDYGIAITGVAGPAQSEDKPVGLVYIALKYKNEETQVRQYMFPGNRAMIKTRAAKMAMYMLWQQLRQR